MLGRGVHDHRAPPAAHVEQPHARLQRQLLRHQLELRRLRLLQRRVGRRVDRARVGHRRPEHPLVEGVRHVVVVRDRLAVALLGVQPARRAVLEVGRGDAVPQRVRRELAGQPQLLRARDRVQRDVRERRRAGRRGRPRPPARPSRTPGRGPAARRRRQPRERRGETIRTAVSAPCPGRPCCRRSRARGSGASDPSMLPMTSATCMCTHRPSSRRPWNTGRAAGRAGRSAA